MSSLRIPPEERDYPAGLAMVNALAGSFPAYGSVHGLDPTAVIENFAGTGDDRHDIIIETLAQIDGLIAVAYDDEDLGNEWHEVGLSLEDLELPEGMSWTRWTQSVKERLQACLDSPAPRPLLVEDEDLVAPAISVLDDEDGVVDEALALGCPDLEQIPADGNGHARVVTTVDLGHRVGTVTRDGQTTPGTVVRMVVSRATAEQPALVVAQSCETEVEEAVQNLYPDLVHVAGGYFGANWKALHSSAWGAQRAFLHQTGCPAWDAVAEQLRLLLDQDDQTLRAHWEALGAHLSPPGEDLRRWLDRMVWRMDYFDWPASSGEAAPEGA